jgi:broad specificity phosphatase PhoE
MLTLLAKAPTHTGMKPAKPNIRFLLIRHGESTANADPSVYRQLPDARIPLSAKGWQQAQGAGDFLARYLKENPDPVGVCLFTSSFLRARQTAQAIYNSLREAPPKVSEYDWLVEQDFGIAQGYGDKQEAWHEDFPAHGEHVKRHTDHGARHFAPKPSGESRADVTFRVQGAMQSAFREQADTGRSTFIIATHSVALRQFVKALLKLPYEISDADPSPGNCDIRLLQRRDEGGFGDFGYIWKNGAAVAPVLAAHPTTQELFERGAYDWSE